jgi:predicted ATPase
MSTLVLKMGSPSGMVLDAAPMVADVLQSAPGLRVLVTSRVVLRIRGEQEWRVGPLGVPPPGIALEALAQNPAVRLFVDRDCTARRRLA